MMAGFDGLSPYAGNIHWVRWNEKDRKEVMIWKMAGNECLVDNYYDVYKS